MRRATLYIGAILGLFLSSQALAFTGQAEIHGTEEGSNLWGFVQMEQTKKGIKVSARIKNAPPGQHGFHIHEFGDCSEKGKSAGGHYNPRGVRHGHLEKDGLRKAHLGDLGNITIKEDGTGEYETVVPFIFLVGKQNAVAGRAFILHAMPDDFGQPTGNAGSRIGCGPIILIGP